MLIDNKKLSDFNATLIDRVINTGNYNTTAEWVSGAPAGSILNQKKEFRKITLKFYFQCDTEQDVYLSQEALIDALDECNIIFDDAPDLKFHCYIDSSFAPNRVHNSKEVLTIVLKNDVAVGPTVTIDKDLVENNFYQLTINFYENYEPTMMYNADGYLDTDKKKLIKTEYIPIEKATVGSKAAAAKTWSEFLGAVGVDINKYKTENLKNGLVSMDYSASAAASLTSIDVIYDHQQTDNYADLPDTFYPNLYWHNDDGAYFFKIPSIAEVTDIKDLSIIVWARYWNVFSNSDGNGPLIGSTDQDYPFMDLILPNTHYSVSEASTAREYRPVYTTTSTTSAGHALLVTYETESFVPFRQYGFKKSPQEGITNVLWNGILQSSQIVKSIDPSSLTLTIGAAKGNIGKGFDIARVQIKNKDKVLYDIIPQLNNPDDGYINNQWAAPYEYDMVNHKYIGFSNSTSDNAGPSTTLIPYSETIVIPTTSTLRIFKGRYTAAQIINGEATEEGVFWTSGTSAPDNAMPCRDGKVYTLCTQDAVSATAVNWGGLWADEITLGSSSSAAGTNGGTYYAKQITMDESLTKIKPSAGYSIYVKDSTSGSTIAEVNPLGLNA